MRNYFVLDGVDSRDFGVYISGQGTFSAPARSYDMISIPGRSGDLYKDNNRFENGGLTYPAFICRNFKQNIADFRAFLLSLRGYHRLADSYHPNEYRMVSFQGEFAPDVTAKNDAASFDITFNCKPQRFLLSGEEVVTLDVNDPPSETFSGNPATFEADGEYPITDLSVAIDPIQDLNGYDSPWPAGGGVNLLDTTKASPASVTAYGCTFSIDTNNVFRVTGTVSSQYPRVRFTALGLPNLVLPAGTYKLVRLNESGGYAPRLYNSSTNKYLGVANESTFTEETTFTSIISGTPLTGETIDCSFQIMVVDATKAIPTAYSPYSNICPISGWTGANIYVSPTTDAEDGTTHSITFPTSAGTVYGATLDVTQGKLTVDRVKVTKRWGDSQYQTVIGTVARKEISLPSVAVYPPTTGKPQLCSIAPYKAAYFEDSVHFYINSNAKNQLIIFLPVGTSDDTEIEVSYELVTPIVYDLTPTEVTTLLGTNNVWSDTGAVEGKYTLPFTVENPTRYNSQPLLRVYGAGNLGINGDTITVSQADGYTDIDCEMMDAFKGLESRNQYVTLTNYNFPVLIPGVNGISLGSGITKVEITPRWWTV